MIRRIYKGIALGVTARGATARGALRNVYLGGMAFGFFIVVTILCHTFDVGVCCGG